MKLKDVYVKLLMIGAFILTLPLFSPAGDSFALTGVGQSMATPSISAPGFSPYMLARTVETGTTRGGGTEGGVPSGSKSGGVNTGGNGLGIDSGSGTGSGQRPTDLGPVRQRCPNCPRN